MSLRSIDGENGHDCTFTWPNFPAGSKLAAIAAATPEATEFFARTPTADDGQRFDPLVGGERSPATL